MSDPVKWSGGSIPLPGNHDSKADGYVYTLRITRLPDGENFYYVGETEREIEDRVRDHDVIVVGRELPKPDGEGTSTEIMFEVTEVFGLTNVYNEETDRELKSYLESLEEEVYLQQVSRYGNNKVWGGK